MDTQEIKDEWPVLGENDPPLDLTRENAAFEREGARPGANSAADRHGGQAQHADPRTHPSPGGSQRLGMLGSSLRPVRCPPIFSGYVWSSPNHSWPRFPKSSSPAFPCRRDLPSST